MNDINNTIIVTKRTLSREEASLIWSKSCRQMASDFLTVFCFYGVFAFFLVLTIAHWFVGNVDWKVFPATVVLAGLLTSVTFAGSLKRFLLIRLDIRTREYEEWLVTPTRAVEVVGNGSWPCVALQCGDESIVIAGGWWQKHSSRRDIEWTDTSPDQFPSSNFRVRRFPGSGRVFGVSVSGQKLKIEQLPARPLLSVPHAGYDDCKRHNDDLDRVIQVCNTDVRTDVTDLEN